MNIAVPVSEARFAVSLPLINGQMHHLPLQVGRPLFIVGANGTGKSSLMQYIYMQNQQNAVRISAHRPNSLQSNVVPFSPHDKIQAEQQIRVQDAQPAARWNEWNPQVRSGFVVFNLIEADNRLSRETREKLASGDDEGAKKLAKTLPPLQSISELFHLSGIPITLSIVDNGAIVASKNGSLPYSIAALSDGERNALLTAGTILTAKPGSLILVDEPERHLHSSIVTPLLSELFLRRPDCAFVVSTHELSLPVSFENSRTTIVRDSRIIGEQATAWDLDELESNSEMDESLKRTVLGSRRKIIFVEGGDESLDKQLYELIFPGITISARRTCGEVERCVDGIIAASNMHWLDAYGIVDQDQLDLDKKAALTKKNIYPLNVYSVEGIYYHPDIQKMISLRQGSLIGGDANLRLNESMEAFIEAVSSHKERLAARMTEQSVKDAISLQMPDWKKIQAGQNPSINVDAQAILTAEKAQLDGYLFNKEVVKIISRYPIRETPGLEVIAQKLGFKDQATYEAAVRLLVKTDTTARDLVMSFLGDLPAAIN